MPAEPVKPEISIEDIDRALEGRPFPQDVFELLELIQRVLAEREASSAAHRGSAG